MSDTNVGLGMVPCRKGCRCLECENAALKHRVAELERLYRGQIANDGTYPGHLFDAAMKGDAP